MHSRHSFPRLLLAALSLLPLPAATATINSDYFSLPQKSDAAFTVHNGDVLNVTWLSTSDQAVLYMYCGSQKMNRIPGLSGNGHMAFAVNTSWTSPCHWQFALQADEATFFDSGWVDVTNRKATPVVTWQPSAAGTACGVQRATGVSTVTVTSAPAATGTGSGSAASEDAQPALSTGASVGVGFAVGVGVAGATAAAWMLLWRRRMLRGRVGGAGGKDDGACAAVCESSARPVHELHHSFRPAEADAGWDARRVVELPPETAVAK